jgi:hypothetical protein
MMPKDDELEAVDQPLDEVYGTMMDVALNPSGAFMAIQSLSAELKSEKAARSDEKKARLEAVRIWVSADSRADLCAERDAARAWVHRLCYAGDQFAAYMHPVEDENVPRHRAEYRKWRALVNEAIREVTASHKKGGK